MSFTKAKEHLQRFGLENKIMEFEVSSATVAEAALAIGCTPNEIAKSISFNINSAPVLVIAAGGAKIDNAKFKAEFQTKAKMLSFDEVEPLIGHAVGGVCPFGVNPEVTVYLDNSLKRFDIVYPACGSSNSAVKLTLEELEKASGSDKWVDVCKEI